MATMATPLTSAIEVVWHYVRDVARSVAWYERVFGLSFQQFGEHWAETKLGDVRFALHVGEDVRPGTTTVDFRVGDIAAVADTIRAHGVDVGEIHRMEHGSFALVVDPDGYRIEIFEPRT